MTTNTNTDDQIFNDIYQDAYGDENCSGDEQPRCKDCGTLMSPPIREERDNNYSELVSYCTGCGATEVTK